MKKDKDRIEKFNIEVSKLKCNEQLCEHAYGEKGCYMMDTNQKCTPYPENSKC